jgi:hypothetical protein
VRVRFKGSEGFDQRVRQGSDALRTGSEYTVLEIFSQSDGPNYFRIEFAENERPPLFDSRLFEVTDSKFHDLWVFLLGWDGSTTIGPAAWNVPGFWDDFMNNREQAVEVYRSIRDRIMPE